MIGSIVLAAGSSRRMGKPKALLRIGQKTFLQHIVDILRSAGLPDTAVVLGAAAEQVQQTLNWFDGKVVTNSRWEEGQLSSLVLGISSMDVEALEGALVWPVDHPLISSHLIGTLIEAFHKSNKKIVAPTFHGIRGHPVIFSRSLFGELRSSPGTIGARAVVHNHPLEIFEVPTEEEGIIINIDTPQDYDRHIMQSAAFKPAGK